MLAALAIAQGKHKGWVLDLALAQDLALQLRLGQGRSSGTWRCWGQRLVLCLAERDKPCHGALETKIAL